MVLVCGAAVVVALNWSRLKELSHQAASTFTELIHVQTALERRYGGIVSVMAKRQTGVDGTILSVTLVNPIFLEQLDIEGPAGKAKAMEAAIAARDALRDPAGYGNYEIVLVRERGTGITISHSSAYRFGVTELPRANRTEPGIKSEATGGSAGKKGVRE